MPCLHPFQVRFEDAISHKMVSAVVPCGHCVYCLQRKQNDWYLRMSQELLTRPDAVFFSLTYNEKSVPFSDSGYRTCCKTHVQNWIKLGRELFYKKFHKRLDFKYFVCSEYGPRTFRPHYHGVFFGIDHKTFTLFFGNVWRSKYGFVSSSSLWKKSYGAVRYVSKYCNKGMFECPLAIRGLVEKPFRLVSKGLGVGYVEKFKNFHLAKDVKNGLQRVSSAVSRSRVYVNGFGYSLPRYYRAKIFGAGQDDLRSLRFRRSMSNFVQRSISARDSARYRRLCSEGLYPENSDRYFRDFERTQLQQAGLVYARFAEFYDKSKL